MLVIFPDFADGYGSACQPSDDMKKKIICILGADYRNNELIGLPVHLELTSVEKREKPCWRAAITLLGNHRRNTLLLVYIYIRTLVQ
jgi:hypothetical protein